MSPGEILSDAKDMAKNYPGDRLRLTGQEVVDLAEYVRAEARAEVEARVAQAREEALDEAAGERGRLKSFIRRELEKVAKRCSCCAYSNGGVSGLLSEVHQCMEMLPDGWLDPEEAAEKLAQARREALEEAAKHIENTWYCCYGGNSDREADGIAESIRALARRPEEKP